jgi:hypothetical protein
MKSKRSQAKTVIGMAWYRPDQWERLRQVSMDADELETTYEEWVAVASARFAELKSQGAHVEKVDMDVEEWVQWCFEHHKPLNADSRSEFAARKLAR